MVFPFSPAAKPAAVANPPDTSSHEQVAADGGLSQTHNNPARRVPMGRRLNPAIGPGDPEYVARRDEFRSLLRRADVTLDDILRTRFEPHDRLLVMPQPRLGHMAELQRDAAIRFHALLAGRFSGEGSRLATKLAFLWFGLPVEPIRRDSVRYQGHDEGETGPEGTAVPGGYLDEEGMDEGPLDFLVAHDRRNYGRDRVEISQLASSVVGPVQVPNGGLASRLYGGGESLGPRLRLRGGEKDLVRGSGDDSYEYGSDDEDRSNDDDRSEVEYRPDHEGRSDDGDVPDSHDGRSDEDDRDASAPPHAPSPPHASAPPPGSADEINVAEPRRGGRSLRGRRNLPPPPLRSAAERVDATRSQRERSWAEQPSIFSPVDDSGFVPLAGGDAPQIPNNAPSRETSISSGSRAPAVSRAVLTPTEQAELQRSVWDLRNVALERTIECPYPLCRFTYRADDDDAMAKHLEAAHTAPRRYAHRQVRGVDTPPRLSRYHASDLDSSSESDEIRYTEEYFRIGSPDGWDCPWMDQCNETFELAVTDVELVRHIRARHLDRVQATVPVPMSNPPTEFSRRFRDIILDIQNLRKEKAGASAGIPKRVEKSAAAGPLRQRRPATAEPQLTTIREDGPSNEPPLASSADPVAPATVGRDKNAAVKKTAAASAKAKGKQTKAPTPAPTPAPAAPVASSSAIPVVIVIESSTESDDAESVEDGASVGDAEIGDDAEYIQPSIEFDDEASVEDGESVEDEEEPARKGKGKPAREKKKKPAPRGRPRNKAKQVVAPPRRAPSPDWDKFLDPVDDDWAPDDDMYCSRCLRKVPKRNDKSPGRSGKSSVEEMEYHANHSRSCRVRWGPGHSGNAPEEGITVGLPNRSGFVTAADIKAAYPRGSQLGAIKRAFREKYPAYDHTLYPADPDINQTQTIWRHDPNTDDNDDHWGLPWPPYEGKVDLSELMSDDDKDDDEDDDGTAGSGLPKTPVRRAQNAAMKKNTTRSSLDVDESGTANPGGESSQQKRTPRSGAKRKRQPQPHDPLYRDQREEASLSDSDHAPPLVDVGAAPTAAGEGPASNRKSAKTPNPPSRQRQRTGAQQGSSAGQEEEGEATIRPAKRAKRKEGASAAAPAQPAAFTPSPSPAVTPTPARRPAPVPPGPTLVPAADVPATTGRSRAGRRTASTTVTPARPRTAAAVPATPSRAPTAARPERGATPVISVTGQSRSERPARRAASVTMTPARAPNTLAVPATTGRERAERRTVSAQVGKRGGKLG